MEQIDQIVIPILSQCGCPLKDVQTLKEFDADLLLICVSRLLKIINPQKKTPKAWPDQKSGKFRLGSKIATQFKNLGFDENLGYQNFMYPEVHSTRKLLMFLVEKLPKEEEGDDGEAEVLGAGQLFQNHIKRNLSKWTKKKFSTLGRIVNQNKGSSTSFSPSAMVVPGEKDEGEYWENHVPFALTQVPSDQLCSSLISFNTQLLVEENIREIVWADDNAEDVEQLMQELKQTMVDSIEAGMKEAEDGAGSLWSKPALAGFSEEDTQKMEEKRLEEKSEAKSAFQRRANFTATKQTIQAEVVDESGNVQKVDETGEIVAEEDEEEIVKNREETLHKMNERIRRLQGKLSQMDREIGVQEGKLKGMKIELNKEESQTETLMQEFRSKKVALDMLPNHEENLQKLHQVVANTKNKLLNLAQEWENHRTGLLEEYRRRKRGGEDRKAGAKMKMEELKKMRVEMKSMAHDVRDKEEVYAKQVEEWERMPKSVDRSVYVNRIMDIVKNLRKQKNEITKILKEVKDVQKETNRLSETSKRTFMITDEQVFKIADNARDRQSKGEYTHIYKNILKMRENFEELLEHVESKGNIENEIKDMRNRIDQIESRNDELNMSRLKEDLSQLQVENEEMESKLES